MITIIVKGRMAKRAGHEELVTSGSVKMKLRFEFDSAWDGLSRLATFKGADDIDVLLDENNACDIPWEAVETSGKPLMVGVYGTNSDGVVIPTIYCNVGMIRTGAEPSETTSQEATPTAVQQMLTAATTCTTKATAAAASAATAVSTANAANETANSAKNTALNARANATIAATNATTAASAATSAASSATSAAAAAQSVVDRANAGEFNGATGPQGPQGPQGPRGDTAGVFYATNGTTSFDDIKAAYTAGDAIFCKRSGSSVMSNGNRILPLTYVRTTGDNAQFCFTDVSVEKTADGTSDLRKLIYCICRPDGWTSDVINDIKTVNGVAPGNDGNIALTIPAAYDDTALAGRVSAIEAQESGWNAKQAALTAGEGISITNNVISATGGSVGAAFILALQSILEDAVFTSDRSADIADLINHAGGDLPDGDGVSY